MCRAGGDTSSTMYSPRVTTMESPERGGSLPPHVVLALQTFVYVHASRPGRGPSPVGGPASSARPLPGTSTSSAAAEGGPWRGGSGLLRHVMCVSLWPRFEQSTAMA